MVQTTKVAVVTGGGQGIGLAIAQTLRAKGYRVVVGERNAETIARAQAQHPQIDFQHVDVSSEEDVKQLVRHVLQHHDRLDLLVNNAAISDPHNEPIEELSLVEWNRRLAVNLTSVFLCVKYAVAALRASKGSIVNISSTRSLMSEPCSEAYAAAKGGADALTHALAISLGPDIRVNGIRPGWIDTTDAKLRSIDHSQHPVGRVGRPSDIAEAVDFLASPAAGFITGQVLTIDGGMTRKMVYAD